MDSVQAVGAGGWRGAWSLECRAARRAEEAFGAHGLRRAITSERASNLLGQQRASESESGGGGGSSCRPACALISGRRRYVAKFKVGERRPWKEDSLTRGALAGGAASRARAQPSGASQGRRYLTEGRQARSACWAACWLGRSRASGSPQASLLAPEAEWRSTRTRFKGARV